MGGLCQVPKIMYTISYAFNIALLIEIIVITTTERLFECICLLSRMLQNLGSCVLLGGFTNFSVDPYYDPLSLVMIQCFLCCSVYLCISLLKLLQVNTNGVVSLDSRFTSSYVRSLPLTGTDKIMAPFWANVDTRGTGQIFYRQTTDHNYC